MGRDVLHDVVVLQFSGHLLLQQDLLLPGKSAGPDFPVSPSRPVHGFPEDVRDQLDDLPVAVGRLAVGQAREGGRGLEPGPLCFHLGRLAPLRLRELGGDDDQAQVDHEERTDLGKKIPLGKNDFSIAGILKRSKKLFFAFLSKFFNQTNLT